MTIPSCVYLCICVLIDQLCLTLCNPWAVACQASLSMGFSGQEYWSGLPFPSPGDFPNLGIKTWLSYVAGRFFTIWVCGSSWMWWEGLQLCLESLICGWGQKQKCYQRTQQGGGMCLVMLCKGKWAPRASYGTHNRNVSWSHFQRILPKMTACGRPWLG